MFRLTWLSAVALLINGWSNLCQGQIISLPGTAVSMTSLGINVKPTAINASGVVVGQNAAGVAFQWDNGTFTTLGTLGGTTSYANDINNAGVIVGWSTTSFGQQKAFKYESNTLINIDPVSTLSSNAEAINNSSEIVGWKSNGSVYRSSLWNAGFVNGQLIFGSSNSQATGINDNGKIVGITLSASNTPQNGYYWNGSDPLTSFSSLIGSQYFPTSGININDLTAGERLGTASILKIGDPQAGSIGKISPADAYSIVEGINNIGLAVGDSGMKGFAYDLTTSSLYNVNDFPKLDLGTFGGIQILNITDINDNNQFVGTYRDSLGDVYGFTGAFVAIPEPSTWLIGTLALCGVGVLVRKRRAR